MVVDLIYIRAVSTELPQYHPTFQESEYPFFQVLSIALELNKYGPLCKIRLSLISLSVLYP